MNGNLNEGTIKNKNLEKENHNLKEEVKELNVRIEGLSQTLDSAFNKFQWKWKKVENITIITTPRKI